MIAMMCRFTPSASCALAAALAGVLLPALAQGQSQVARPPLFPPYNAAHVWQGLYGQHLPPLAGNLLQAAQQLQGAIGSRCEQPEAAAGLRQEWQRTLQAWQALATPALGPVLTRRSQRQIDFWPARPALIEKALQRAPQDLAALETTGAPAKGFPGLEWILAQPLDAARCHYAGLLAQGIVAEAQAIASELEPLRKSEAGEDEQVVGALFVEWANQWLAGWERLRWAYIEQPIQKARHQKMPPEFARRSRGANLADWQAQWQALQAQARLQPEQMTQPPQPGKDLISIQALLVGKGHLVLAARWAQALARVGKDMAGLHAGSSDAQLLALSKNMKAVTVLFQNEVAAAMKVPLGFSDADGD